VTQKSYPIFSLPEWQEIYSRAVANGLAGEIYSRWRQEIPDEALTKFKQTWKNWWVVGSVLRHEFKKISHRASGLRVIPLKGMALKIYANPGCRRMTDIDLLSDPTQIKDLEQILLDQGFRKIKTDKWKANDFKQVFWKDTDSLPVTVETHTRLFWQEKFDWGSECINDRSLTKEAMLVHLCGHLASQHTFASLHWLVDVDRFVRKNGSELDWRKIWWLAEKAGVKKSVEVVLRTCEKYLCTEVGLPLKRHVFAERILTSEFLWDIGSHRSSYLLLKHALKEGISQALMYDLLWLLNKMRSTATPKLFPKQPFR